MRTSLKVVYSTYMHLTHVTGGTNMQTIPLYEVVELEVVEITITDTEGN